VGEAGQGGRRDIEGLCLQETIGECYYLKNYILMYGYVANANQSSIPSIPLNPVKLRSATSTARKVFIHDIIVLIHATS